MNTTLAHSFLVPVDFTERSVHALHYAAGIVKKYDGIIHLLHVVDERIAPGEELMDHTRERINEYARKQQEELKVNIIPNIVRGNIFISIGEAARKLGVQLIVMGIHGMHGIQFIIGSFAARVILGSPVPVLLTNGSQNFIDFKNIVLPFDNCDTMPWLVKKTIELGKQFNSTVHIFAQQVDGTFLQKRKSAANLEKTINSIRKAGLNCQSVTISITDDNLAESIVRYAENIRADIIMVTTKTQHDSSEYIIVETGIRLMENSKTPLFFFNPS